MIAKVKIKKEVELKTLRVTAGVRYWEDAKINGEEFDEDYDGELIPCKNGDSWCPVIDIDTGRIANWTQGVTADIHFTVCDAGVYEVIDQYGTIVHTKDGYVPSVMCPKEEGYGDYIIMDVDENGIIQNWKPEDILEMFDKS